MSAAPKCCAAIKCAARVPHVHMFCGDCWRELPPALQRELAAAAKAHDRRWIKDATMRAVDALDLARRQLELPL